MLKLLGAVIAAVLGVVVSMGIRCLMDFCKNVKKELRKL